MRDAVNLAWKLQLASCGLGGERLLDTYNEERRPTQLESLRTLSTPVASSTNLPGGAASRTGWKARTAPDIVLADGRQLDATMGDGFAVILSGAGTALANSATLDEWRALGATVVEGPVPFADGIVVVRPDRSIASVSTTAEEFAEHTARLMEFLA